MSKIPRERTIILSQQIDQKAVNDVVKLIFDVNRSDEAKYKDYKKFKRKPIQLVLNTYGGVVYDGLAMINAIESSKTPVHITALGSAMSMGLFILASGHKRFINKNATVMYHQISSFSWGKIESLRNDIKEAERLEKICEDILFEKTKIKPKDLKPFKKQQKEWYMDAKEALKYGIVDKIV
ncbi:MAG: ATP-dependent Clp protease proteolytic subunit [Bacteroidota bacterium]